MSLLLLLAGGGEQISTPVYSRYAPAGAVAQMTYPKAPAGGGVAQLKYPKAPTGGAVR